MSIDLKQLNQLELYHAITGSMESGFNQLFSNSAATGLYLGYSVVYVTGGNQTISGQKTFSTSPNIPYTGTSGQPVSLRYLSDLMNGLQTGNFSGITASEYLYVPAPNSGRSAVNLDYIKSLGVVYSTGSQVVSGDKTFSGRIFVPTATGGSQSIPFVQFQASGQNYLNLLSQSSGDLSSRIVNLEYISQTGSGASGVRSINQLTGNVNFTGAGNVFLYTSGTNGIVFSGNPSIGPSGASGVSFIYKGNWTEGVSYNYFDWVNITGMSFVSLTGHTSYLGNRPYSGSTIWALLSSGSGPIGPKGDPAILFSWRGNWNAAETYNPNEAVYFSGSSYGYTGLSSVSGPGNSPSTNTSWSIVVAGQPIDTNGFYPINNPSGFITGINSGAFILASQTGIFAANNHNHNYVTALKINGVNYTGVLPFTGLGSVVVSNQNGVITFSGGALGGSSSGTSSPINYKSAWRSDSIYSSGDSVSYNNTLYIFTGALPVNGVPKNPISVNSDWAALNERNITVNSGDYSYSKIYYPKGIVRSVESNGAVNQFINLGAKPLLGMHPKGYYNFFEDCDGQSGKNLLFIASQSKNASHPFYAKGDVNTYSINGTVPNDNYSGFDGITLIRGETYYFDKEITNHPFILTANVSGGSYSGQITNGLLSGARLLVNSSGYSPAILGNGLYSGVFKFTPDQSHPDTIYFQSAATPHVGYKINLVNTNPWSIFSSGAVGGSGLRGAQGSPGLAFVWKGNWDINTSYSAYDTVYLSGSSWATLNPTIGTIPSESSLVWFPVSKVGATGASGLPGINWRGNWNSNSNYFEKDAVFLSGSSYIAQVTNFGVLPSSDINVWNIMASSGTKGLKGDTGSGGLAFTWRSDWSPASQYFSGDSVYYNGSSYATNSSVSGTMPPDAPWFTVARQGGTIFSWRGNWASNTPYYNGDSVFYGGSSYGTLQYVSGEIPVGSAKWFTVSQGGGTGPQGPQGNPATGVNWRSYWTSSGVYNKNDIVRYKGAAYIVTSNSISGTTPYSSGYDLFVDKGDPLFSWEGQWQSNVLYFANSMVSFLGSSYATLQPIPANVNPTSSTPENTWFLVAKGNPAESVRNNFYQRNPSVGQDLGLQFLEKEVFYTGYSINKLDNVSSVSGSIYYIDLANGRTTIADFGILNGSYNNNYIYNFSVPANARIGYNLSAVGAGVSGLSVTLLGYSL